MVRLNHHLLLAIKIALSLLLFSCSTYKEEHKIANAIIENEYQFSKSKKGLELVYIGKGLMNDPEYIENLLFYKTLYNDRDLAKHKPVWSKEGYNWFVSDKDIDYILSHYNNDTSVIKWNKKKFKRDISLYDVHIGETQQDTIDFYIERLEQNKISSYISKPVFTKNKKTALLCYSVSYGMTSYYSGLVIVTKIDNKWVVIGKASQWIH